MGYWISRDMVRCGFNTSLDIAASCSLSYTGECMPVVHGKQMKVIKK